MTCHTRPQRWPTDQALLSRVVDRAVDPHQDALAGHCRARTLVANARPIDLLVGSALFRDSFVHGGRGHVDLPRLRSVGYGVVGLTVATTWPNIGGSLSRWQFRSLGLPGPAVGSRMAIANWVVDWIERWCAESDSRLVVVRSARDVEVCLAENGPVGVLLGVQGGHVLEGDAGNVALLRERGISSAPAHVMDNDVVGSGTGRVAGGLSTLEARLLRKSRRTA